MSDTYTIAVTVTRSLEDDAPIACDAFPGDSLPRALAKQLARELQDGWDNAAIAGHFECADAVITSV